MYYYSPQLAIINMTDLTPVWLSMKIIYDTIFYRTNILLLEIPTPCFIAISTSSTGDCNLSRKCHC